MNRILIKNTSDFNDLLKLIILNVIHDNISTPDKKKIISLTNDFAVPGDRNQAISEMVSENYVIDNGGTLLLGSMGVSYFNEDFEIEERWYNYTFLILEYWNKNPHTGKHKIKPYLDENGNVSRQSKIVVSISKCVKCLMTGSFGKEFNGVVDADGNKIEKMPKMTYQELAETVVQVLLRFEKEYYPQNKSQIPKSLKETFCSYKKRYSVFLHTYHHGVCKRTETTVLALVNIGISVPTLKLAYETLLQKDKSTSEVEKLKVQQQIILLHKQWEELKEALDKYYIWNKDYRNSFGNFNTFTFVYISWMKRCIAGERFIPFLQIKEGHMVYENFKGFFFDEYKIRLYVPRKTRMDLLSRTEKYKNKIEEKMNVN